MIVAALGQNFFVQRPGHLARVRLERLQLVVRRVDAAPEFEVLGFSCDTFSQVIERDCL